MTVTTGKNPAPGFSEHPDHVVIVTKLMPAERIVVKFAGEVVADSLTALRVEETNHPPRYYIPMDHVAMGKLHATDKSSYCPFKGKARYWTVIAGHETVENGAWAYDAPYDECADLAGHIAFYSEKIQVDVIEG